jgi:hypothetical protein
MSKPFTGFCGPTYAYTNKYAAVERAINLYPVVNESGEEGKFKLCLNQSPGTIPFGPIPLPSQLQQPCRGMIAHDQYGLWGVNGNYIWNMNSAGTYVAYNILSASTGFTNPVSMNFNGGQQLGIADKNLFYVQIATNPLLGPSPPISGADYVADGYFTGQDGYAIAIRGQNLGAGHFQNYIQISGTSGVPVGDWSQWDAANISVQLGQNDPLQAVISSREYVRLLGSRRSQVLYNAGAQGLGGFPFQNFNQTFIETGIDAPWSLVDMGDSLIWIGQDARGVRACWQDSSANPVRISTFAVEQFWQTYSTLSDAIAFAFIWDGHLFYQVSFPTAGATWVYDDTSSRLLRRSIWHERTLNNSGTPIARAEKFHAYCFGKHLVASDGTDGTPGAVYQYTNQPVDMLNGTASSVPIPQRICPHIFDGLNRIIIDRLRFDMRYGNTGDLALSISRDGGNTFGSPYFISVPSLNPNAICYLNRLGYARDLVISVEGVGSVTNQYSFVGAYIDTRECSA